MSIRSLKNSNILGNSIASNKVLQVVSTTKTDTFSASLAAEANTTITGLSISHALSSASNKLLIIAQLGAAGSTEQNGQISLAPAIDGNLFALGDAAGSRTRLTTAGGPQSDTGANYLVTTPGFTVLYEPGDTSSHTYTLEAINNRPVTRTVYVNRSERDSDAAGEPRSVSTFTIMEIAG